MANPYHPPAELAARSASEGLLVADWERILFVNPAFAKLLGVTVEGLVGQPVQTFGAMVAEHESVDRLRNALRQGQPYHGEVTSRPEPGVTIPMDLRVTPVASGDHWMVVIAARDLRQRKRIEHQLWQSQRLDAVTSLTDGIAHEVNNVVQVLAGYGSLLAESLPPDDPRASDLKAIEEAARRGGALLRDLLDFARRRPTAHAPIDLNEVIEAWQGLIQILVGPDLRLIFDLAADLPSIRADRGEVQQILINLVSNAREAMIGGGTLTIATHQVVPDRVLAKSAVDDRVGEYVVLTVTDTGVGMSSDTKAHLFQPFFTTKDERGGRGLGLATVQQIVREAGGLVWVRSKQGEGTSVEVHFPALKSSAPRATTRERPSGEAIAGTETVLLVDDDPLVLRVARRALERFGYLVFAAESAAEATAIASEHGSQIDLLLADVMMPGQRGTGLADELKADWPHLKVLFMSGYPGDESTDGSGAALLAKPFEPEELAQAVRVALGDGPAKVAPTASP